MSNPQLHRFTLEEWNEMGTLDLFGPKAHMELLDGDVLDMSPLGRRHRACVILLTRLLVLAVGTDGMVNPGGPVELDSHSELEPDLVVLRFREDAYRDSPSTPADVLLLIEVSDSSLGFVRGRKAAAYSRSGIDEYWIIDLVHEEILVMRDPGPEGYRSVELYRRGQAPSPRALPHVVVPVADVLGPSS